MRMTKIAKIFLLVLAAVTCLCLDTSANALVSGIGSIATQAKGNLVAIAKLITAASYVAGMGFGVAAIVKFKAHKDNATQIPISLPIALLFIAAALLFIPTIFKSAGGTLFGSSGVQATTSGVASF